jgi:pimeloyl-ACP methyl ester carboxylesterase
MSAQRTVFLLEHGVSNASSEWRVWVNRAIELIHTETEHRAQGLFYFTTPLTVWVRERQRCRSFAEMLRHYSSQDWRVVLVGHSNGTRVLLEGLKLSGCKKVESVHLLCGACDADFKRNGLNRLLVNGTVGRVHTYRACDDWAMRAENLLFGRLMFGIPNRSWPLGLVGPQNVLEQHRESGRVVEHEWPGYGHSTCWTEGRLRSTMKQVLSNSL